MRGSIKAAVVCAAAVLAGGCASQSGLSKNDAGGQAMPMLMYTAANSAQMDVTGPIQITVPAKVGVAQMGEIVPPEPMLVGLRTHPELFSRVAPISGSLSVGRDVSAANRYGGDTTAVPSGQAGQLGQMRRDAAGLDLDYLLVFGGQIDHGNQGTGLQLLDLTIVGAFIVPSHGVSVDGRAAGSLIEVKTGRVVQSYAAQSKGTGAAPTAFLAAIEEGSVQKNREELVDKLMADVVTQMTEELNIHTAAAKAK